MEERTSLSNEREERQRKEDSDTPKCKCGVMQKESSSFSSEIPAWVWLGSAEHWAHRAQLSAAPPWSSSAPHVLAVGLIHPFISSVSLRTSEWQRMPQAFLIKLVPFHNTFFLIFLNTYGMKNKIALHFPKEDLK